MVFKSLPHAIALALVCTVVTGAQERAAIQPFTIRVADPVLADLRARLARARIPEPLQGDGWTHGTDIRYLRELVAYWRDRFDWRA